MFLMDYTCSFSSLIVVRFMLSWAFTIKLSSSIYYPSSNASSSLASQNELSSLLSSSLSSTSSSWNYWTFSLIFNCSSSSDWSYVLLQLLLAVVSCVDNCFLRIFSSSYLMFLLFLALLLSRFVIAGLSFSSSS